LNGNREIGGFLGQEDGLIVATALQAHITKIHQIAGLQQLIAA